MFKKIQSKVSTAEGASDHRFVLLLFSSSPSIDSNFLCLPRLSIKGPQRLARGFRPTTLQYYLDASTDELPSPTLSSMSDTTYVDSESSFSTATTTTSPSPFFFISGAIKVKAAVSDIARRRGGHKNCPCCKAKRVAAAELKEANRARIVLQKAPKDPQAKPAWRY